MIGVYVLVAVLVLATAFGLYRRVTDGRIRNLPAPAPGAPPEPTGADPRGRLTAADLGQPLAERATLVQFSTAFCQPCRAARRILDEVSRTVVGVSHVEIDAEAHLDLVRRLDVRRTPTIFLVDADGRIRNRATGAPRKAEVLAVVGDLVGDRFDTT